MLKEKAARPVFFFFLSFFLSFFSRPCTCRLEFSFLCLFSLKHVSSSFSLYDDDEWRHHTQTDNSILSADVAISMQLSTDRESLASWGYRRHSATLRVSKWATIWQGKIVKRRKKKGRRRTIGKSHDKKLGIGRLIAPIDGWPHLSLCKNEKEKGKRKREREREKTFSIQTAGEWQNGLDSSSTVGQFDPSGQKLY